MIKRRSSKESFPNGLERSIRSLELVALDSMSASVADYFRRRPSGTRRAPRWAPEGYPYGTEKELYAEIAYVLLSAPEAMLGAVIGLLGTSAARDLMRTPLVGPWRAYRLSTVRSQPGRRGPLVFPGAAGHGGIADIGFFRNPTFDPTDQRQIRADTILYFELKSSDRHPHRVDQLRAHLKSLDRETATGVGYLAAIGGRPVAVDHPRWLGHVTLNALLKGLFEVALSGGLDRLVDEVDQLRHRKERPAVAKRHPLSCDVGKWQSE